jgi:hypothetical protein
MAAASHPPRSGLVQRRFNLVHRQNDFDQRELTLYTR